MGHKKDSNQKRKKKKKRIIRLKKQKKVLQNWRDKKVCVECGTKNYLTIHHIIIKSDRGSNQIKNLDVLCRKCHNKVHEEENNDVYLYN